MTKSGITDILYFFLSIYKLQLNAPRSSGQFSLLSGDNSSGADLIYELQVIKDGKQRNRRISIGPLGEDSGSKSTCYKVIYDDLLVVKIPPVPITDFEKYLEHIQTEKEIADRIMPDIECIAPSVSAILRKIPAFSETNILPDYEERCIRKLRERVRFQDYLRIGNSFVFFMNLSRYAFLGQVVDGMHWAARDIRDELEGKTEILQNPDIFENIYGKKYASLYYPLHELFFVFEEKLAQLQKKHKLCCLFPSVKKKQWFLSYLADKHTEPAEPQMTPEFVADINHILRDIISGSSAAALFRRLVKKGLNEKSFQQNKAHISGIISNLIDMLARLREKGIAIRDLKPDNVFIAGDSSRFPHLLSSPEEYSIGLIDFETAVIYGSAEKLRQPMLGGTPSYATPSHIFKNELLQETYEDLPRIFHLQDWQAVISMIHIVITGEHLARKTSKLMPEFIRVMKKSLKIKKMKPRETYIGFNRVFWSRAAAEFTEKLSQHTEILQNVRPKLSEKSLRMLTEEISEVEKSTGQRIQNHIRTQHFFKSPQSRSELINAPLALIRKYRRNWEQGTGVPNISHAVRIAVIKWLKNFEKIKADAERKSLFISMLSEEKSSVSAYDLLDMMFSVVLYSMYISKWGELRPETRDFGQAEMKKEKTEVSREDTMALEKTVGGLH
ncbi:MAG: hypothetical protein V2I97_05760 [Desulfococcaceae bacterium]|jgi:serine/threonine protein kinase|nr:hypothetical protein [Desulfococcaceae bacterium]